MVEPEHHECVGVGENPLVNGQPEARLVDALEYRDGVAGDLAREPLEVERGAMEQLQRAGDPLQELRRTPLRLLVGRPQHVAHFGHGREAILHLGRIALRLERIAPGPVDAQPAFARRVFAGDMALGYRCGRAGVTCS